MSTSPKKIPSDQEIPEVVLPNPTKPLLIFFLTGLLSGLICLGIHVLGTRYTESIMECPHFNPTANVTKFSLNYNVWQKILSNQYIVEGIEGGKIERKCPSKSNDFNVFSDDLLSLRTDTLFDEHGLPDNHRFEIFDCHHKLLLQFKNNHPIEMFDAEGKAVGNIREENYKGEKRIFIFDEKNTKIAKIEKSNIDETTWEFEILDQENAISKDWRVLVAIFGKVAVPESDLCNGAFNFTGIVSVVFMIISAIMFGFWAVSSKPKEKSG